MKQLIKLFEKMMPFMLKFANCKPIKAIKDGFLLTMPLTLVGSIFLLLANLPISGYSEFMQGIFGEQWVGPFNQVVGSTFDIVGLIGVFGVAYAYAKNENLDGISAGVLGIVAMLIISKSTVMVGKEVVGGVIPKEFMGGKGMIAAILVGLVVGYIFTWFIKRDIRIKLPDGVPPGVANAFSTLIPAFAIIVLSFSVYILFDTVFASTLVEKIYDILQTPLQSMTDSVGGLILLPLIIGTFWWNGIHGSALVGGVIGPLLRANGLANQAVVESGKTLVVGENASIFTIQLLDQFITFGGAGITVGLVIAMVLKARSSHMKELGKLSIIPGFFNINEPIIFGLPIVFNPIMLIPFILVPTISALIAYIAIITGFMQPFTAVEVPWTMPPILSGFIVGGFKGALLQVVCILMSAGIYYPFMKILDDQYMKDELELAESKK